MILLILYKTWIHNYNRKIKCYINSIISIIHFTILLPDFRANVQSQARPGQWEGVAPSMEVRKEKRKGHREKKGEREQERAAARKKK